MKRFEIDEAHVISTPIEKGSVSGEVRSIDIEEDIPFREAIGSLMYLAIATRPNIAYAVSTISQKLQKPSKADWEMVKRIFKYLKGNKNYGLFYKASYNNGILEVFSDSDYASDTATRKSTSGIVCKYSGGPVSWISQKHHSVSLSTTEAEYIAASEAAKECIWLKRFFSELAYLH